MEQNKTGKYLKYAIGEIVLVVVGILIALSINNWNEDRKEHFKLNVFRANLIVELQSDLRQLDTIKVQSEKSKQRILNYVDYYNLNNPNIDTLVQKMNDMDYRYLKFTSSTFSIEEIISIGYLSLFREDEKKALLALKSTHIEMKEYYKDNVNDLMNYTNTINRQIDVLFLYGYATTEHSEVVNWKYNTNSTQFRLFNNETASVLYFYYSQKVNHNKIREDTLELLAILKNTISS